MTVSTSANRADYLGNGATTAFPVPFYFPDATSLKVLSTVLATGVSTTLTLNSDYTVSGAGVSTGGTITTTVAPASGVQISILLNLASVQNTHYVPNDPFPAASHEAALDYLTLLAKQTQEQVTRAIQVPAGEASANLSLPAAALRANLLLSFDSAGNPVVVAPSSGSAASLATDLTNTSLTTKASGQVYHNQTLNYAVGTIGFQLGETYYANGFPWLCVANATTDQSAAMQAAVNYVASVGGTLKFAPGTYLGRIDFSGTALKSMTLDAQGATFRPYVSTQSEVFYCKNSTTYPTVSGQFTFCPVVFRNVNVMGRLTSAASDTDSTGHCDYGVNFICASAKWYDCTFQYGRIAAYHGYYHQYGEFNSCLFGAAVYANTTAGCLLDGNTTAEASNENRFYSTKVFSNKNGIVIKGGVKNRLYSTTIQDTRAGGTAGVWLTTDSSGLGADNTEIHGTYAEINAITAILVGTAPNTLINGAVLLSSTITSDHAYNLALRDVNNYGGGSITLAHPAGNADTASVSVVGGNIAPSLSGLAHAGPTFIDVRQPAIQNFREDSPLASTGTTDVLSVPFVAVRDWFGFKGSVAKATTTPIFSLTLNTFATSQVRQVVFKLELFMWDDLNNTSQYGYSSHAQTYTVGITCNTSGTPQVTVVADSAGFDAGISAAFQASGNVAVTASVSGQVVTFSVNWPGAGTGAAGMSMQAVAYNLRGAGTNSFYLTRL